MNGLDNLFDLNHDGKLETWEQGAEFQFLDDMTKLNQKKSNQGSVNQNAGSAGWNSGSVDSEMDIEEVKSALEDAGMSFIDVDTMDIDELNDLLNIIGLDPDEVTMMDPDDLRYELKSAGIELED